MIGHLLEDNADPSVGDKNGATALHYATFLGHIDSVEVLMRHPEVQDLPDEKGRTALMWAAAMAEDRREIIQLLCRHGSALDTAKYGTIFQGSGSQNFTYVHHDASVLLLQDAKSA